MTSYRTFFMEQADEREAGLTACQDRLWSRILAARIAVSRGHGGAPMKLAQASMKAETLKAAQTTVALTEAGQS